MAIDGGLRKLFRENLPKVDWVSIESGLTDQGIPDSNGCLDGVEVWVEYKLATAWSVSIRAEQVAWAERRLRAGGRVFLAVRRKHDGGARLGKPVDELWLFSAWNTRSVLMKGLKDVQPLGMWGSGPARWDWVAVCKHLTGER